MRRHLLLSSSPILLVLTPLLMVALWLQTLYFQHGQAFSFDGYQMPLYALIYPLIKQYPNTHYATSMLLLLLLSIYLLRINQRFMVISQPTYLPAFLFVLYASIIPDLQRFTPVLPAAAAYIYMIEVLFRHYELRRIAFTMLKVSFFIGISSFFYAPALYMLIPLWIGMALLRPFFWREWVYSFIGISLPFIFYLAIGFLQDSFFHSLTLLQENLFYASQDKISDNLYSYLLFLYLLFTFVLFLFNLLQGIKTKIRIRRFIQYLAILTLSSFAFLLLIPSAGKEFMIILLLPYSILASHYYINTKQQGMTKITVYALLFVLILNQLSFFAL